MPQIRFCVGSYPGNIDKRLDYISSASIYEFFPDDFMKEFTRFSDVTDFFKAIGCDLTAPEDLNKLQDTVAFDSSIRLHSDFESWQDMVETAYQRLLNK